MFKKFIKSRIKYALLSIECIFSCVPWYRWSIERFNVLKLNFYFFLDDKLNNLISLRNSFTWNVESSLLCRLHVYAEVLQIYWSYPASIPPRTTKNVSALISYNFYSIYLFSATAVSVDMLILVRYSCVVQVVKLWCRKAKLEQVAFDFTDSMNMYWMILIYLIMNCESYGQFLPATIL